MGVGSTDGSPYLECPPRQEAPGHRAAGSEGNRRLWARIFMTVAHGRGSAGSGVSASSRGGQSVPRLVCPQCEGEKVPSLTVSLPLPWSSPPLAPPLALGSPQVSPESNKTAVALTSGEAQSRPVDWGLAAGVQSLTGSQRPNTSVGRAGSSGC